MVAVPVIAPDVDVDEPTVKLTELPLRQVTEVVQFVVEDLREFRHLSVKRASRTGALILKMTTSRPSHLTEDCSGLSGLLPEAHSPSQGFAVDTWAD